MQNAICVAKACIFLLVQVNDEEISHKFLNTLGEKVSLQFLWCTDGYSSLFCLKGGYITSYILKTSFFDINENVISFC